MDIQRNNGIFICLSAETAHESVWLRGLSSGEWILPVLSDNACLYVSGVCLAYHAQQTGIVSYIIITAYVSVFALDIPRLTPYLNIFNWIGYFALGILCGQNHDGAERVFARLFQWQWFVHAITVTLITVMVLQDRAGSYWGGIHTVAAWSGALSILLLSRSMARVRFLQWAG